MSLIFCAPALRNVFLPSVVLALSSLCSVAGPQGKIAPLVGTASWIAQGIDANGQFGYSVASAGDVNGDGFDDVIVGAPNASSGAAIFNRVFVYMGTNTGLAMTAAWTQAKAGSASDFGTSVSGAGDVNGDGFDDVIVGDPGNGNAYVYHGSATGLSLTEDWLFLGGGDFGYSVAGAGDLNGDGYDDIIVGAPSENAPFLNEGRAYVFHGSAAGLSTAPAWSTGGLTFGGKLGSSVASAGDVNHDGFDDVIIGAPFHSNPEIYEGAAFVYHGSTAGLGSMAAWSVESDLNLALFGVSVASAGDVDGDLNADVIVGAEGVSGFGNTAYVFNGSAFGLGLSASWSKSGVGQLDSFGHSVASAGDVNGDGFSDIIVGAIGVDPTPGIYSGRAYVYEGSPSGPSSQAAWTIDSSQSGSLLGQSVASAGDVNGDGISDVIVGASKYDTALVDAGQVVVYHGTGFPLQLAMASFQNGAGINPSCLACAPPVLGQAWNATIDASLDPTPVATVLAVFKNSSSGTVTANGEYLVDLSSMQIAFKVAPVVGQTSTFNVLIPAKPGLVGLKVSAQGAVVGANVTLCNAYELVLGY